MTNLNQSNQNLPDFWKAVKINIQNKRQNYGLKPVLNRDNIPVSFAQEYLWVLHEKNLTNSAYNIGFTIYLHGNLDILILEKTLQEIINRHEILRTLFVKKNNLIQVIAPYLNLNLPVINLPNLSESEQKIKIQQILTEEKTQLFKLSEIPLWRFKLIKISHENYLLSLTIHHIIWDTWSNKIFQQELAKIYEAFLNKKPSPLPKLTIQYADYAYWQRHEFREKTYLKQQEYWEKKLAGDIQSLILPLDFYSNSPHKNLGSSQFIKLDQDLTNSLKIFSDKQGVSLFITLLTSFKILLYCYSSQEDLLVCSAIASRNHLELKNVLGYFNNILPLRTKVTNNPNFKTMISLVSQTYLEALENQDFPFHHIANFPHLSRTSLTKAMFSFLNTPKFPLNMGEIEIKPWQNQPDNQQNINKEMDFDIFLHLKENQGVLTGNLRYKTDLFKPETIKNMVNNWQILLRQLMANTDLYLSDLPLFSEQNKSLKIEQNLEKEFIPPQTTTEKKLSQIWSEVLKINQISISDNFFALGGHSLSAIQVISRILRDFQIELPLNYLFEAPTITQLSHHIESLLNAQNSLCDKSDKTQIGWL